VGTQPVGPDVERYCRDVEAYLCRKNDGHLIRVVGPSFERVSGWAVQGIPIKVTFRGIDRYFERYYRNGSRRRPVRIDFCEADVLDLFDEWRRAVGIQSTVAGAELAQPGPVSNGGEAELARPVRQSLPGHLERVVMRLTEARANGTLGAAFDELIDRIARELDTARGQARGLRGAARQALIERLAVLDAELLHAASELIDAAAHAALVREAEEELAGFRTGMTPDAFARARRAATDRLLRERLALPTVVFTG
jgi:hypothetical protein